MSFPASLSRLLDVEGRTHHHDPEDPGGASAEPDAAIETHVLDFYEREVDRK